MKLSFNIKFDKVKKIFAKLPRTLAENSFPVILLLFFVSLVLGGFIYYEYVFLVKNREPQLLAKPFRIDERAYQTILDEWQARENIFQEVSLKQYPDPFNSHQSSVPIPPVSASSSLPVSASSSESASATNPTLPVEP